MREIKFRAWDKYNKRMIVLGDLENISLSGLENKENTDFANYDVMQYTGLKDKNGVGIYEGDIVSAFLGTQFSAVFWDEEVGAWMVTLQTSGGVDSFGDELLSNHLSVLEVVGNVYENQELLAH